MLSTRTDNREEAADKNADVATSCYSFYSSWLKLSRIVGKTCRRHLHAKTREKIREGVSKLFCDNSSGFLFQGSTAAAREERKSSF